MSARQRAATMAAALLAASAATMGTPVSHADPTSSTAATPPATTDTAGQPVLSSGKDLRDEFAKFAKELHGKVAISVTPAGGTDSTTLSTLDPDTRVPAWGTIRIPVALAAARSGTATSAASSSSPTTAAVAYQSATASVPSAPEAGTSQNGQRSTIDLAIAASDTTAATDLWKSLGPHADQTVERVLAGGGDDQTDVGNAKDYVQLASTPWAVDDQSKFGAGLLCQSDRTTVT